MNPLLNLTADNFIDFFKENFLIAVIYDSSQTFQKNEIVSFNNLYYISLIDNNYNPPLPPTNPYTWNQIATGNIITINDINKGFQEALTNFNFKLFPITLSLSGQVIQPDETPPVNTSTTFTNAQIGLLYLAAHYVQNNIFLVNFGGSPNFIASAQGVDNVSKAYRLNETIIKSMGLAELTTTEFGKKYISMISPLLRSGTIPFIAF